MADKAITRWKQRGSIYLWRQPQTGGRDDLEWHYSAGIEGAESLAELVRLLLASPYRGRRRVETVVEMPAPSACGANTLFATSLTLVYPLEAAPELWHLSYKGSDVTLTLGEDRLREFGEAAVGVLDWKHDYALRSSDETLSANEAARQRIWFWTTATRKSPRESEPPQPTKPLKQR